LLPLTVTGGEEFVFLDDLAAMFQLTVRDEFGAVTVTYKNKSVLLTPDQSVVSVSGRLVALPAPPVRNGRRLSVPVEFISRALGLVYDAKLDVRKASRLLVVGDWRVPRISVRLDPADPSRIVIDAVPRTESVVSQQNAALLIRFEADALDTALPAFQPNPLVQAMRVVEPATIAIDLGPRFASFRASSQPLDTSTRLTVEVMAAADAAAPAPAAPAPSFPNAPPPDISQLGQQPGGLRSIAIDPGHGGEDEGVKGTGGAREKDIALAVARRLKTAFESRLGIRVMLTREDDRNVALVNRVATANNGKADLFISLHANASFRNTAIGASILSASFDRENEQSARASLGPADRLPAFGGGVRDVELVRWDLAQVRHVTESRAFASLLLDQLRDRVPLSPRPVERAPIDVLESANMPAVLVEMGYLTNAGQEAQLGSAEYQDNIVQAIFEAVTKFRDALGGIAR
jgi:N-acetylmuramoyl-L-alanine amidase